MKGKAFHWILWALHDPIWISVKYIPQLVSYVCLEIKISHQEKMLIRLRAPGKVDGNGCWTKYDTVESTGTIWRRDTGKIFLSACFGREYWMDVLSTPSKA